MRVKPLEKPLEQPWQSHRYYLSRRKETRLAKNRVSVSIPYALPVRYAIIFTLALIVEYLRKTT